jgi:hypothetical protein
MFRVVDLVIPAKAGIRSNSATCQLCQDNGCMSGRENGLDQTKMFSRILGGAEG